MAENKVTEKDQNAKKALGMKISKIRQKRKMTLSELSEKSGVNFTQISKYEHGVTFPSDNNLIRLAKGLGVTVSELFPEKSYLDMPQDSEPSENEKTDVESNESMSIEKAEDGNKPAISIYTPNDEEDTGDSDKTGGETDDRGYEITHGYMTEHFVDCLISATGGFSDDPRFIGIERLLLEAYVGYCYISYGTMKCLFSVLDMLHWSEPKAFVEDDGITEIDEMFDELSRDYDGNFAKDKYEAVKSQLQAMPEMVGVFLSCMNRINKLTDFLGVYAGLLYEEEN